MTNWPMASPPTAFVRRDDEDAMAPCCDSWLAQDMVSQVCSPRAYESKGEPATRLVVMYTADDEVVG